MLSYLLAREAEKQLQHLPSFVIRKILEELDALCQFDHPLQCHQIKKLKGVKDLYRLRVGEYRIVFVMRSNNIIAVTEIATRQNISY